MFFPEEPQHHSSPWFPPTDPVSGNLLSTWQSGNQVFATPNGSPGFGLFRSLVSTDIPSIDFSKITTGIVPITQGGVGVSLSGTGGASQVLKQVSSGANITVGQLATTDLSDTSMSTWTPTDQSGASLTLTTNSAHYIKMGKMVYCQLDITYPVTADTSTCQVSLPFVPITATNQGLFCVTNSGSVMLTGLIIGNAGTLFFTTLSSSSAQNNVTLSGSNVRFVGMYQST